MNDRHVREELPGWLSGELAPARADAVRAHLLRCDTCRVELVDTAGGAALLHDVVRLALPEPDEIPPLRIDTGHPAPRRRPRRVVGAAVAAALVVVVGAVAALSTAFPGGGDGGGGGGGDPGGVRLVALGPAGSGAEGVAHMEGSGDEQRMVLDLRGLPPAPSGHFYELWLLDPAGRAFSVGLVPPSGGSYPLPADDARGRTAVDVSLEPEDGDTGHSGTSVLRGSLV